VNSPPSPAVAQPADLTTGILPESAATSILQAIEGLRYGQVTVIVQDGRVLQIDRTERFRLTAGENSRGSASDLSTKSGPIRQ
jgi:hypothetical protein